MKALRNSTLLSIRSPALLAIVVAFFLSPGSARGAKWTFNPLYDGTLKIEGTVNCDPGGLLFEGHVQAGLTYEDKLPTWANDYQIDYVVDPPTCENRNQQYKVKVDRWDEETNKWVLEPLDDWVQRHAPDDGIALPFIIDMRFDGEQVITCVVNIDKWLADPRQVLDRYDIVDGRSDDLPGFLIGTTPIIFDPDVGPNEIPFSTTLFTGPVERVADLSLTATVTPTVSEWGLILMAMLLLTVGAIVIVRRKRQVAT